ncbi:hypothetical protein QYF61_025509 [Mycteria americana]|uniref:Uncharacterized protein n=1 Tax=Mycteria americana TaxID=33587 RepID=A0AAN7S156_MYCAM|nr:hypothetical protein QYF61_025509 [Mycteria americana]
MVNTEKGNWFAKHYSVSTSILGGQKPCRRWNLIKGFPAKNSSLPFPAILASPLMDMVSLYTPSLSCILSSRNSTNPATAMQLGSAFGFQRSNSKPREDEEGIKTVLKAAVIQVLGLHFHDWKLLQRSVTMKPLNDNVQQRVSNASVRKTLQVIIFARVTLFWAVFRYLNQDVLLVSNIQFSP